jgi:subtilisin family serine protease
LSAPPGCEVPPESQKPPAVAEKFEVAGASVKLGGMVSAQVSRLGVAPLWETTRGKGVKIGVLDTGVHHSRALPTRRIQAIESDGSAQESTASSHGTSCVSLIASELEGAEGIAPESRVLSIRVTSGSKFSRIRVKQGLRAALDAGCDLISCSFTLPRVDHELKELVREAHLAGIPIIAASGNEPDQQNELAESVPHAVVIGAVDVEGNPMPGRHTIWTDAHCLGDRLDIVDSEGNSSVWSGLSSGAAALVAGVVALALAPLTPARRRMFGIRLDGLLKTTATRRSFPDRSLTLLRVAPARLFEAAREMA